MVPVERQAIIEAAYTDEETGIGSLRETYQMANAKDTGIRYIDVKAALDRYAHRQTQARYKGSNSFVSPHRLSEIEVDLVDLTAAAEENEGCGEAAAAGARGSRTSSRRAIDHSARRSNFSVSHHSRDFSHFGCT